MDWSQGSRKRVSKCAGGKNTKEVRHLRHGGAVVSADGDEGGAVAVAVALGSVPLGVAQLAVDLTVRSVAGGHGVQGAVALATVVASFVPLLKEREALVRGGPEAAEKCDGRRQAGAGLA